MTRTTDKASALDHLAARWEAVAEQRDSDARRSEHANALRAGAATLRSCAADLREILTESETSS